MSHCLKRRAGEGCNPSERFETQCYLAHYPDVAAGGMNPLVHYQRHGANEGRECNPKPRRQDRSEELELIGSSDLFDCAWYLDHYTDVRESGVDPVLHYLRQGAAEGNVRANDSTRNGTSRNTPMLPPRV
jgi:hypothetical protein